MSTNPQLTTRDVSLLAIAFQCLKDESALQIDYNKFAELAGYKTAASANACFLLVKKKLLSGASVSNAAGPSTPKKAKGKAAANGDVENDDEETAPKAVPKKRVNKAVKTEPADAEVGDADNEITPAAETPKKGRAKKNTNASSLENIGDTNNDTATAEASTPAPKRKRAPKKPKDPNTATPTKRVKKSANAQAHAGNTEPHADDTAVPTDAHKSIFGGDAHVKEEGEEDKDDRLFDTEEQKVVDEATTGDANASTAGARES